MVCPRPFFDLDDFTVCAGIAQDGCFGELFDVRCQLSVVRWLLFVGLAQTHAGDFEH
jgi:hypothetical protein